MYGVVDRYHRVFDSYIKNSPQVHFGRLIVGWIKIGSTRIVSYSVRQKARITFAFCPHECLLFVVA